jgi:hypothetical protein
LGLWIGLLGWGFGVQGFHFEVFLLGFFGLGFWGSRVWGLGMGFLRRRRPEVLSGSGWDSHLVVFLSSKCPLTRDSIVKDGISPRSERGSGVSPAGFKGGALD